MQLPAIPVGEKERLAALEDYNILDTLPEKDFDDITKLASEICDTPISTVTLIDSTRQWFKSHHGIEDSETSRDVAFCAHAINKPNDMLLVPDSRKDDRFVDNPLIDSHQVIFYAGVPLTNPEGHALGTLCVIDSKPRQLSASQSESLKALANQVVKLFELRRKNILLEESQKELEKRNDELNQFSYVVSHDIKSPLKNMIMLTEMLNKEYGAKFDASGAELLSYLNKSSLQLKDFIDGILAYYKGDSVEASLKQELDVTSFLKSIIELLGAPKDFMFNYPQDFAKVNVNKTALEQIFINLLGNSIKYNDKAKGVVDITFSQNDDYYTFKVSDNGTGIAKQDIAKIFTVFVNLGKRDRYNNVGTGIGLSTVKKIVERLGGKLTVTSEVGIGSIFTFTIRK